MTGDQPPAVEIVTVRPASLPPSPADAAFSIIRLDRTRIQSASRLDEALAQVPGVSLFRRTSSLGANPTTQGVSLRGIAGSGAGRALVTLDGVPQNDPFGGWVIWSALPTEDISGASIVRGAGAGPYGAGALTGVIALEEAAPARGAWELEAEGGSLGYGRGAAVAGLAVGSGELILSAAGEHSDGWTPVIEGRGAADQRLTLDDRSISLRFLSQAGATSEAWRVGAYEEDRGSGLVGASSRSRGVSFTFSAARPSETSAAGWKTQVWLKASDLANTSVSVAPDRQSAALSNNQYETPALGYGVSGALRWRWSKGLLEWGLDARGAVGEDRELFKPVSGALTGRRFAGGQDIVAGTYLEAVQTEGRALFSLGARLDGWETFDADRREQNALTGAPTLIERFPARGGVLPSGRLAVRYDLGDGGALRLAGYTGFRAPTLNELFRPFRVGNNITEANPNLVPERLYGVDGGLTWSAAMGQLTLTGFYNRLENPVTNVTLASGPIRDPVEGFVPAGGLLLQRRNVGAVDAYGLEAEGEARPAASLVVRAAVDLTHARVDGGSTAPRLTGRIPTETPELTATASFEWSVGQRVSLTADVRYEGPRYDNDQNTLRLAPATTAGLRVDWRARRGLTLFAAMDNLFDERTATGETAGGIYSYGPPRMVRVGLNVSGKPR